MVRGDRLEGGILVWLGVSMGRGKYLSSFKDCSCPLSPVLFF